MGDPQSDHPLTLRFVRIPLPSFRLPGPGTVLLALVLGSCAKVDVDEQVITQTYDDPIVHEVDCAALTLESFSAADNGLGTGSVETLATGGTPPYAYEWADSTGAVVGLTWTVLNLPAGPYTVDVTDSLGCSVSDTVEVDLELSIEGEVIILFVTSNAPEPTQLIVYTEPSVFNYPYTTFVEPGLTEIPYVLPENTVEVEVTWTWSCGNVFQQGPNITVSGEGGYPVGGAFVPIAIGC